MSQGWADEDYDPLAPMYLGEVAQEDFVDDGETWYHDPDLLVRVQLEQGRLSQVRISPVWHLKLGNKTLEQCFAAAFAAARVRVAAAVSQQDVQPDLSGLEFGGLPRFGRGPFNTYRLALENFNRRWAEAVERVQNAAPVVVEPSVAEQDGVKLWLDADGQATEVNFDAYWLQEASTGEISSAVLAAAKQAYEAYEPATSQQAELAELALEHEIIMAGFLDMLTGKDR